MNEVQTVTVTVLC